MRRLESSGFSAIRVQSIADHTFPSSAQALGRLRRGEKLSSIVVDLAPEDRSAARWLSPWRDFLGFEDYLIVTADKA